jgi:DNA-directed RNA polymerase subunit RPC12/RpoP
MVVHKCFFCEKVIKQEYLKKKVRCPYCGSKVLYKPKTVSSKIKAV